MSKKVIVIGGGIAGLTIAGSLAGNGLQVVVFEKEAQTGGHVKQWDRLFHRSATAPKWLTFLTRISHRM